MYPVYISIPYYFNLSHVVRSYTRASHRLGFCISIQSTIVRDISFYRSSPPPLLRLLPENVLFLKLGRQVIRARQIRRGRRYNDLDEPKEMPLTVELCTTLLSPQYVLHDLLTSSLSI
jgi:hypothetical protein